MMEHTQSNESFIAAEEKPEQVALAISVALDFLSQEAEKLKMHDVGDLIKCASEKAKVASVAMRKVRRQAGLDANTKARSASLT